MDRWRCLDTPMYRILHLSVSIFGILRYIAVLVSVSPGLTVTPLNFGVNTRESRLVYVNVHHGRASASIHCISNGKNQQIPPNLILKPTIKWGSVHCKRQRQWDLLDTTKEAIDVVYTHQHIVVHLNEELEGVSKDLRNVHLHFHSEGGPWRETISGLSVLSSERIVKRPQKDQLFSQTPHGS